MRTSKLKKLSKRKEDFMNYSEAKEKATALVSKMTYTEIVSQLLYNSPAIEHLNIKEYNWWNEALHGVARAGTATVFPQSIGLAATFNPTLIGKVASAIATEGRAKYNQSTKYGDRDIYKGLTYWSPNINIFRDGRWGRGQETFGEDPHLTAVLGCEFIKGLQGGENFLSDDRNIPNAESQSSAGNKEFLKAGACAKHFAVHSGPEKNRHSFDAAVSKKDLFETYLPAFEWAVKKAGVIGVMGAYNRTNGEPCCAHTELMEKILLEDWGFKGYYVSDCGAIQDIYAHHHYTETAAEAASVAVKRGCNLNCGKTYQSLVDAYEEDLITDEDLQNAAVKLFTVRYLLGEFEENRPYSDIPYEALDCDEHKALNLNASEEAFVLLKNNNYLPLQNDKKLKIAIIGPNANNTTALEGNYNGIASHYTTPADGIREAFKNAKITVEAGSNHIIERKDCWDGFANMHSAGIAAAENADVTFLCLGLDRTVEGEEGCPSGYDYSVSGDRTTLYLPKTQQDLAEKVCDVCENVVVIVLTGSPVDLGEKVRNHAKAIIHGWYPGAEGGKALASIITGAVSPSGRLPITFPYGDSVLPDFEDYSMAGRTYRYATEKPLYPFGFGLGYTKLEFSEAAFTKTNDGIKVKVKVTNNGDLAAAAPIQVYASLHDSRCVTPIYQLCAFDKIHLGANETKEAELFIDSYWLSAVTNDGERVAPDGEITLYIGDRQPDERSAELTGSKVTQLKLC